MSLPPSLGEPAQKNARHKSFSILALRLLFATATCLLLSQVQMDYLESYFYDLRVRWTPSPEISDESRLVFFDQKSVQGLKSDLNLNILLQVLQKIQLQKPKHIILSVNLEDLGGTPAEKEAFAKGVASYSNLIIATDNLALKGDRRGLQLSEPFQNLHIASAPRTSDLKIFARDNVTRRMLVSYQGVPLLHAQLAGEYNPEILELPNIRGTFDFAGSQQALIRFHPSGSYPRFSAIHVLQQSAGDFHDKIVIIGNDTEQKTQDYILTPYSRDVLAMNTAEMHANMIDTLIFNRAPIRVPKWVNLIVIWILSVFAVHVVLVVRPGKGLRVLGATLLSLVLISYLLFWFWGLVIWMAGPFIAVFLCYYFLIPYRLILENRRSWEYYEKNKLLSQVEELKTNFISMMSHDLKTPIARIQGMTDVILTDHVKLSPQQREAVDTIRHSSDDLLKFINAILNYGKIESQGVQLNLQSKDINKVLEEVILKHEFLAKLKRIHIVPALEPQFPIAIDSDLMRQIFSNLIENAIKYSPEETQIRVSSEESEGFVWVQVSDQGPGIPEDELGSIFMKFFRSKNAKSSPIKGSGLGLYLAKYFTELHGGEIFVESSRGNGSTFRVKLPIKQGGHHA